MLQRFMTGAVVACAATVNAETVDIVFDEPTLDRWFYPFNSSPGTRITASTFSNFEDFDFDNRDGQVLLGFDTTPFVAPGQGATNYDITSLRVTIRCESDLAFAYDETLDSYTAFLPEDDPEYVADADPGQPIEIYGTAFRNEWTAPTFLENGPYSLVGPFGKSIRNAYAFTFDGGGAAVDISNHVDERWTPQPWALGIADGLQPGDLVPAGTDFVLDVDTSDPLVQAYLRDSLNEGMLDLCVSSLTRAQVMGGEFTSWFMREHPFVVLEVEETTRLEMTVVVGAPPCLGDIDGDGMVGFSDLLVLLASWGACTCPADLDGNGFTDFNDLLTVLAAWGDC